MKNWEINFWNLFWKREVKYLMLPIQAPVDNKNKVLVVLMWLKTYPSCATLAYMFGISRWSVSRIVHSICSILYDILKQNISWPSLRRWRDLKVTWRKLPEAVGEINGTSNRIYIPSTEPQRLYYSGHRRYHCVHTQIVIDAKLNMSCWVRVSWSQ